MTRKASPYIRCAEDIALLRLLDRVPVRPSHNPHKEPSNQQTGHALSLREERHLAADLATLSSIKDDPNSVTAICIKQSGPQLLVLVAANAAWSYESGYLKSVKVGFDEIFRVLREGWGSGTPRDKLNRGVLMAVVAMCRGKITKRGRLGNDRSKPRFFKSLEEVSSLLDRTDGIDSNTKARCQRSLHNLMSQMRGCCEQYQAPGQDVSRLDSHLADIIEECGELLVSLHRGSKLLKKLEQAAKPEVCPATLETVLRMAEKMSQYRSCAERLVKLFRAQPLIRRASTIVVWLEKAAFTRHVAFKKGSGDPLQARAVLGKIAASHGMNLDFSRLAEKLKHTESEADKLFRKTLKDIQVNSRIHAEMQLIWYLDSHPSRTPPRVIASNKDACYLCSAFIKFHGIYTIPRSHGRLYPGWRLPATGLGDIHNRFIQELERTVIHRAQEVLHGAAKLGDPLESTVNSSMGSFPTLLTVGEASSREEESSSDSEATVRADDGDAEHIGAESEASSDTPVAGGVGDADNSLSALDSARGAVGADAADDDTRQSQSSQGTASSAHSHNDDDSSWTVAEQGRAVTLQLSDGVCLHVEYNAMEASRHLRFMVQQISEEEASSIAATGEAVYDVHHTLPLLQDFSCPANSRFVNLRAGGDMFRIMLG